MQAVIFVVDSADRTRLSAAKALLDSVLERPGMNPKLVPLGKQYETTSLFSETYEVHQREAGMLPLSSFAVVRYQTVSKGV